MHEDKMIIQKQATELADIVCRIYPDYRYDERCTLWGIAFLWDNISFQDEKITQLYREFIPNILTSVSQKIIKPEYLVPKATSLCAHFTQISLNNREILEQVYDQILTEADYKQKEEVMKIISDKKIVEEMLDTFVLLREQGLIDETTDIFDFMLHYNSERKSLTKPLSTSAKPQGSFLPLAARLMYRYGQEMIEESILQIVPDDLQARVRSFQDISKAIAVTRNTIDEEASELYHRYISENGIVIPKPRRVSVIPLEGRRKVKTYSNVCSINWTAILEARQKRFLTYEAFNPQEIILARVERKMTEKYIKYFESSPQDSSHLFATLAEDYASTSNRYEKEVLERVRRKFEIMYKFSTFPIHHVMTIKS